MANNVRLLMESRIHGDMYVRFGGRLGKTYRSNAARRLLPSLLTCVHKETKERIKWDDYKRLSQDEQEKYNVYPKMQVFRVFNVEQTNLKEARPELWQKLELEYSKPVAEKGEQYAFEPVERMITDNSWICPIKPTYGDSAYYSISKNEIVVPEKPQFRDGESFYGTAFHEMAHSTGAEGQLNRINPSAFGSAEYARDYPNFSIITIFIFPTW